MLTVKQILLHYLTSLEHLCQKLPQSIYDKSLTNNMFSLEMNAKIACNFVVRGYSALLKEQNVDLFQSESGKDSVLTQIHLTKEYLHQSTEIDNLDNSKIMQDKAGDSLVSLPQPEFVHFYIVPNILFHMGMVYSIARANNIDVGKGDFDGIHQYAKGFSFIK